MKILLLSLCTIPLLTHALPGFSQTASTDSTLLTTAVNQATASYTHAFGNSAGLYNGPQYIFYHKAFRSSVGHPFFETDKLQPGTIVYNNSTYNNIPLIYDIKLDKLIIQHPTNTLFLNLINQQVSSFTYNNHTFIYINSNIGINPGFYEVLLTEKNILLARHTKEMTQKARNNVVEASFLPNTKYFLYSNNQYTSVSNLSDIVELFPEHKKQLQQFSHENKLSFNKTARSNSLTRLLHYNNTL